MALSGQSLVPSPASPGARVLLAEPHLLTVTRLSRVHTAPSWTSRSSARTSRSRSKASSSSAPSTSSALANRAVPLLHPLLSSKRSGSFDPRLPGEILHRNPTYLLNGNNKKQYVVRTRPPGPLISKTAHAIDREYRILDALGKDGSVPVPKVYHLCLDDQVIGRPWYLMEYLKGRKYEDSRMPEVKTKEERTQLCVPRPLSSSADIAGKITSC